MKKKTIAAMLACSLVIGAAIGGSLAWLTDKTDEVKNVFTTSDITVELKENTYDPTTDALTQIETITGVNNYQMVPGWTIPKNPWVTVTAGSEDCYLFIKVEETGGTADYPFDSFIDYAVKTGDGNWTALDTTNYPGVYYKVINTVDGKGVPHYILGADEATYNGVKYTWNDNEVLTKPTVTKEMMNSLVADDPATTETNESTYPTLTFTAYATQLYKSNGVEFKPFEAWGNVFDANDDGVTDTPASSTPTA